MLQEIPHDDVISIGIGAKMQADAFVRQVVPEGRLVSFAGYKDIPIVNMAKPFTSEVLHVLAEGVLFAAGWRQEKETVVFSLRSKPDGADVAEIAQRFGGGGHKHSAGFTLPFESDDGWSALLGIEEVPR
jgi:oligoribonuclease NrnB/cAMP/cGMP phosphodiesterase (DHH superfamily)